MKTVLLLLLIGGCSQLAPKPEPELSQTSKEVPGWLYAPYEECLETDELCATGEGKTATEAESRARINLASIFEVQLKSELNIHTSSSQAFPWRAQVNQEVDHSINESVDQVLESVQIRKRFKKDGLSFALASLDRHLATKILGERLLKLDQEMEVLWARKQRTNTRKIVKLNLERERLNERYSIVAGTGRSAKVTYEDILKWKDSRPEVVNIGLRVGQAPEWMQEKLRELLTESGFKIVKGETSKIVTMNVESIKEYLNVEGFEKYTFTLNMTSLVGGERNKVISTSETVNGRTQADALLRVKNYFTEYIEQNLSELHLD